jgi:hypothetical protein
LLDGIEARNDRRNSEVGFLRETRLLLALHKAITDRTGKCIITVISDHYLKSRNCMYKLIQINQNSRDNEAFRDRVFLVVLP